MADEILTGVASVEAEQGYEPLIKKEDDAPTFANAREAADSIPVSEPLAREPIKLIDPATGKEPAPNKTLTWQQAADIVGKNSEALRQSEEAAEQIAFQAEIDARRSAEAVTVYGPDGRPIWTPQVESSTEKPQVEKSESVEEAKPATEKEPVSDADANDGLTPETRALLDNPQIRQEVETRVKEADDARQHYVQAAVDAAKVGIAAYLADIPELASLSAEQIPGALALIQQQNPQRHAEIVARDQRVSTLLNQAQALKALQAEQQNRRMSQWVIEQDDIFERAVKDVPKAQRDEIEKEAYAALKEYGVSDDELPELWQKSILRSAAAQRILMDAARYRLAKKGASKPAPRAVPPVQKPGVSGAMRSDPPAKRMPTTFRNSGEAAKWLTERAG